MNLLACDGLVRAPWIDGFELMLAREEVVCLRGRSGSGKTLMLRSLADLDPVDAGRVSLLGESRDAIPGHVWRRRVRFVPQTPPRRPGTVADALSEVFELTGRRVEAPADLPPERELARISGGEAMRLFLTLAIEAGAEVLLVDEPTASLDDERAAEVVRMLRGFADSGGGVIVATHDDGLAAALGARQVRIG